MNSGITRLALTALLLCAANTAEAQTVRPPYNSPMGTLSDAQRGSFSSIEGRYAIALPKSIGGFDTGTFQWRLPEGYFTVSYVDSDEDLETSNAAEARALRQAEAAILDFNRWLLVRPVPTPHLSHKSLKFDGHPAVELTAQMPAGLAIARSIVSRKRIYSLAVMLVGEQQKNAARAIEVFDSFRITPYDEAEAIIKKRIADARPAPLPQEPVVPNEKSDAERGDLKGKVKALFEEIEGVAGRMAGQTRRPSAESSYNEAGNLITRTLYNSAGLPFDITVYGYIDGKRVSKTGHLSYESSPPGMAVPSRPTAAAPKPRDTRYGTSYVYKYGSGGELSEMFLYRNNGESAGRTVYKRTGNQREMLRYSEDGSLISRSVAKLDDRGNVTEETDFDAPLQGWSATYQYSYEFDDRGNWIKRVTTVMRTFQGRSNVDSRHITHRRITYY